MEHVLKGKVSELFSEYTSHMLKFTENIVLDSMGLIREQPPCVFAAVAIGPMARCEATSYDDLKFLLIVKEKNSHNVKYFEKLYMTMCFLVSNMQESKLEHMKIEQIQDWFVDEARCGFMIGGRASTNDYWTWDERTRHICTAESLSEGFKMTMSDPQVTERQLCEAWMIKNLKLIYGYKSGYRLFENLTHSISKTSFPASTHELCFKRLIMHLIQHKSPGVLHDSIWEHIGMMRPEPYCLPSVLALDMQMAYNVRRSSSLWETIHTLSRGGAFQVDLGTSLGCHLAITSLIKLASYLYHNSRCERRLVPKSVADYDEQLNAVKYWVIPPKLYFIFHIQHHLLRIHIQNTYGQPQSSPLISVSLARIFGAITAKHSSGQIALGREYIEHLTSDAISGLPDGYRLYLARHRSLSNDHKECDILLNNISMSSLSEEDKYIFMFLMWITASALKKHYKEHMFRIPIQTALNNGTIMAFHWKLILLDFTFEKHCFHGTPLLFDFKNVVIPELDGDNQNCTILIKKGRLFFLQQKPNEAHAAYQAAKSHIDQQQESAAKLEYRAKILIDTLHIYSRFGWKAKFQTTLSELLTIDGCCEIVQSSTKLGFLLPQVFLTILQNEKVMVDEELD